MLGIARIRGTRGLIAHLSRAVVALLQAGKHLFRAVAQLDTQVVNQREAAIGLHLRIERQFGVGRATAYQGPAGVITHTAEHRGADAGGANHRMRLAAQRRQLPFQPIQRGAGQTHHLLALINQLHAIQPPSADQYDVTLVVVAIRRRTTGQASVGGLHDDDAVGGYCRLQNLPLLQQRTRLHYRQHLTFTRAMTLAKAPGLLITG